MNSQNKQVITLNNLFEKEKNKTIEKMSNIQSRTAFLYHQNLITVEEYNDIISKTSRYIPKEELLEYIDDILQESRGLAINLGKTIGLYKNYDLKNKSISFDNIDSFEIEKLFYSFLKYLNCQNVFDEIIKKDMIAFPKTFIKGKAGYTLPYGKLSYIVVKSDKFKLKQYDNLAHEMGHALSFYILFNTKYRHRQSNIKQEIISILFEKLFLLYLLDIGKLDKESIIYLLKQKEDTYFKLTKRAKKSLDIINDSKIPYSINDEILNYIKSNKYDIIHLYNNVYAIGNIVATKLIENNSTDMDYFIKHLKDIIIELESLSSSKLIKNQFDLPSIERYLNKQLVKIPSKNC